MTETVQLFITCILDTLYPEVAESVCRVLEKAGAAVMVPAGQTCCGQPAFNAGMRAEARRMAIHTIQTFEDTSGAVVVPSGSCAAMIRHSYPELFAGDPEWLPRAQSLAQRTYELTEYLVDVLGVTNLGACYQGKLTYHASCHLLRELGVEHQPRALLAQVQGAEHPEISTAMLERKLTNIEASGAPIVVSCDAGCVTNINGGLHRQGKTQRAVHIAEILDTQDGEENNHGG